MNSTFRRWLLVVSGAVALAPDTACYSFVPSPTGVPAAGAEVRVQLNAEGTTELARYLGPRVGSVDGTLSSVGADGALAIAVAWVQIADGARQPWSGEGVVTFPRAYVTGVQQRTFDKRKSTIAGVALAGALVTIAIIALKAGGSKGAPGGGGGGPPTR